MTRERIHNILDLVLDFNEKMKPQAMASFEPTSDIVRLAIYFEYGPGGYGHIEEYEPRYDFDHGEVFYDAYMTSGIDIDLVRGEARLKELMEKKDVHT